MELLYTLILSDKTNALLDIISDDASSGEGANSKLKTLLNCDVDAPECLFGDIKRLEGPDDKHELFIVPFGAERVESAIQICKEFFSTVANLTFWSHINSGEGYEYYLRSENGKASQLYVDSDGGDNECFPITGYEEWHSGLPNTFHVGAMAGIKNKKLFEKIAWALEGGESPDDLIPEIQSCSDINFMTGYGEDAFTYLTEYGDLSATENTLKVLNAMIIAVNLNCKLKV